MSRTRTAVVTGASSGIGKEVAKGLARQGWRIIGTGRDRDRIAAAQAEISEASTGAPVDFLRLDLSLLADAEKGARQIAELTDKVDVLVNNAGGMTDRLVMTPEGYEANFAGNHIGPFLLTERLLPLLRAAAADQPKGAVRIINTSSDASEFIPAINLDDMQNLDNFSPGAAYCTGKLANVLHARGLAERLADEGITAHAVHPGTVDSHFFDTAPAGTRDYIGKTRLLTAEESADTFVWLATTEAGAQDSGSYWYYGREKHSPNPVVNDPAVRERFWKESEKLAFRETV